MIESIGALDPSLKATGVAIYSPEERFVIFDRIYFDEPFEKTFEGVYQRACKVRNHLLYLDDLYRPDVWVMESPLPVGQFVGGLSALAAVLVDQILSRHPGVFLSHPSHIVSMLGKRRYLKSEIVEKAKLLMVEGRVIPSTERISADEAVAFFLAYTLSKRFVKEDVFIGGKEVYFPATRRQFSSTNLQRLGAI